jgi:hypothetical protein
MRTPAFQKFYINQIFNFNLGVLIIVALIHLNKQLKSEFHYCHQGTIQGLLF